ncbi:MAG TPA: hypothetical protein G4O03_00530 [Dehalococcoidia bacterium]|jgi:hypothetical protein|nr:hypothetical protein [Dehalococcoidia bacterium]
MVYGFCDASRLKPSLESLPVAQQRLLVEDQGVSPGQRITLLEVLNRRGALDLVAAILSSRNPDQLVLELWFDGVMEEWCPLHVHNWLKLTQAGQAIHSHEWDEVSNRYGMVFGVRRFFSDSLKVSLNNKHTVDPHTCHYLLVIYGVFPQT